MADMKCAPLPYVTAKSLYLFGDLATVKFNLSGKSLIQLILPLPDNSSTLKGNNSGKPLSNFLSEQLLVPGQKLLETYVLIQFVMILLLNHWIAQSRKYNCGDQSFLPVSKPSLMEYDLTFLTGRGQFGSEQALVTVFERTFASPVITIWFSFPKTSTFPLVMTGGFGRLSCHLYFASPNTLYQPAVRGFVAKC